MKTFDSGNLFIWNGIEGELENCGSHEDFEKYVRENYMENGDIHPDVESIMLLKAISGVSVQEKDGGGKVCKVTFPIKDDNMELKKAHANNMNFVDMLIETRNVLSISVLSDEEKCRAMRLLVGKYQRLWESQ